MRFSVKYQVSYPSLLRPVALTLSRRSGGDNSRPSATGRTRPAPFPLPCACRVGAPVPPSGAIRDSLPDIFLFIVAVIASFVLFLPLPGAAAEGLADRVVEETLPNGMKVLLVERHEVPIVAFNITYKVGSVNERPGLTGVAHLFEHMAFKGTETLGTKDYSREEGILKEMDHVWDALQDERARGPQADKNMLTRLERRWQDLEKKASELVVDNEMGELYDRNGAVGLNAFTSKDYTGYVVSLPANRVELWAAIESDRMAHPVLRQFYKEKEVVLEERRLRYENSPFGKLSEAFYATAFWAHPYGQPGIGWTSDIQALTRSQTEEFFRRYYAPGNAVVVIVGDINAQETREVMKTYFGSLSAHPSSPFMVGEEPPQSGERRIEVEYDAQPSLMIGYHKPGISHLDEPIFDVIDALLSQGRTSRLYQSLVKEKKIAVSVSTSTGSPGSRYPNLFVIRVSPRAPHTAGEIEEAIYAEVERLKTSPVDKRELEKVVTQLSASLIRSLTSNSGLASQLAFYEAVAGDWRYVLKAQEMVGKATPDDIMRVSSQYFTRRNRIVATLVTKKGDQ